MSPVNSGIVTATGDLFPKVVGVASTGGVAMNAPPASILADVNRLVSDAMQSVPAGKKGALVGIATKGADGLVNVNLAVATKIGQKVTIVGWIGKSWNTPVAGGAAVQVVF